MYVVLKTSLINLETKQIFICTVKYIHGWYHTAHVAKTMEEYIIHRFEAA